jgi:hypothetical protein
MPLQATSGAASYDAFGGGVPAAPPTYIEDVFSTYLYTGNGTSLTVTNAIDLSTYGGLVWQKSRQDVGFNHILFDTVTGVNKNLWSNSTNLQTTVTGNSVLSNGFVTGTNAGYTNENNYSFASWTFRKQPKFFDVVTYTGNGATGLQISHNLGSVPGCIIIKRTDSTSAWAVYHRMLNGGSGPEDYKIFLNTTAAQASGSPYILSTLDATTFTLGGNGAGGGSTLTNVNGATYVAYLFAHNAGGFGLTGTDNVISCGSFTTDGSGDATVNLGYEPQWVMMKVTNDTQDWILNDTMRGMPTKQIPDAGGNCRNLFPNTSGAESVAGRDTSPTSTGFIARVGSASKTYIYIAIRRGPMKVPSTGSSVFSPIVNSNSTGATNTTGFPVDLQLWNLTGGYQVTVQDRLRGVSTTSTQTSCPELRTAFTAAESSNAFQVRNWNNTGFETPSAVSGANTIWWNFRRAPSFFDEVCWTGDGTSGRAITHNLTIAPTLIIMKNRTTFSYQWSVYQTNIFNVGGKYELILNSDVAQRDSGNTNTPFSTSTAPTATQFTLGSGSACNSASSTYVAYLFATCAGVSKVGSYTGNGATQTIDCGFGAGGARFVLIKRTDSTGDWYVYDTARGMTTLTDPYLLLNDATGAAQTPTLGSVTTVATGFALNSAILAAINVNTGTYIFLAIA